MIVLKTSDDKIFEIEEIVAKQSETINGMIMEGCANSTIPLPNIIGETFVKVIEYCKRHAKLEEEERAEELMNFDAEFINVDDQNLLFNLIMAANYLEIKSLLDLACQRVADMIKGKNAEEIRETFNIENDFAPGEESKIRLAE